MNTAPDEGLRHPVPMWRSFLITSAVGELQPIGTVSEKNINPAEVAERKSAWITNKSPVFAADLMNAAFVAGDDVEARNAAEFILSSSDPLAASVKDFASFVLSGRKRPFPLLSNIGIDLKQSIRQLKARVRDDLRDAIAWLDLARLYATMGAQTQSRRAVAIAASLAPENRFILRGAARFYVHIGEPDAAHRLIRRSRATPFDPWLVSTEIALADILKKAPKFYKDGISFIESMPKAPQHISELAAGLGTLELGSGATRKAKKLFTQSMIAPNSNALAQVGWAARRIPGFEFNPSAANIPFSFEAMTQHHMQSGEWDKALEQAENWLNDQIFSSRPATRASYLASVHHEDYARGAAFARQGIRANPEDFTLRNNLVYALAKSGKIADAKLELARIQYPELKPADKVVFLATSGLVCYEDGLPEEGRKLYKHAIEMAHEIGDRRLRAMATLFWAIEEYAIPNEDHSAVSVSAVEEEAKTLNSSDDKKISEYLLARLKAEIRKMAKK